jgi:hypothetical protein
MTFDLKPRSFSVVSLREDVKTVITHLETYIEEVKSDQNPQVVELRLKAEGRLDAFTAMYEALHGYPVLLHCMHPLCQTSEGE